MTPDKAHETVNWQELPGNRANALTVDWRGQEDLEGMGAGWRLGSQGFRCTECGM